MSPRRHHRKPDVPLPVGPDRVRRGVDTMQRWRGGLWQVRGISGAAAAKTYRCPGCDHEIVPGVPHVVAWPADGPGGESDRRHWHTGCWDARDRRTPHQPPSR